jgi:DNA polymerase-1
MTIHRAKYKLDFLSNRDGRPTGLEFGFLKCCAALIREFKDETMILCWEGRDNFRKQIYPDYKANRRKKINESDNPLAKLDYNRINKFKEFLKHPFINAEAKHHEADDVIASLVDRYKGKEQIIIWSNDKDLLQLVDEGVTVIRSFQEVHNSYKWTPDKVEEKYYGLLPMEIPIFLAFTGDSSDNIPGVSRLRKPVLASAIINNRYSENLIQGIVNYELWNGPEVLRMESFIEEGNLQRNLDLIILRRPDVTIKEATNDKAAMKDWLTKMELRSLKLSKEVGVLEVTEDEEF